MKERRKRFIQIFALALVMLLIASSTYAYFAAQVSEASSTNITVNTSTVDNLTFETGDAISISATQSNFTEGSGNQTGSTYASATLVANSDTNEASANYYLYIKIDNNEFEYTTSDKTSELILTITDPDGNEVTSLSGLTYTSVVDGNGNTISGFDITTENGLITIANDYLIESTGSNTQEWNIKIILVNLDSDQSGNASSSFSASLIIQDDMYCNTYTCNTLQAVGSSSYSEKIWTYKNSITKIVFDDGGSIIDTYDYVYDISDNEDNSILAYLVNSGDNTYTTYIVSDEPILGNEDMSYWFYLFKNLNEIKGLDKLITSNTKNMSYMLSSCNKLTSLDLGNFDTRNVIDMSYMFFNTIELTKLDLTSFNTSNVTTMKGMFYGNTTNSEGNGGMLLQEIIFRENWDTSNVTDMWGVFYNCYKLTSIDLGDWDTSKVTDMTAMFWNCSSLTELDVSSFNTSNVTTMWGMFAGWAYEMHLTSITFGDGWDTSNVTDMSSMFQKNVDLISIDLSKFDTTNVEDLSWMFYGCSSLTSLDLSNFDTSSAKDISYMFYNCSSLTSLNLSNAIFTSVTTYNNMFDGANSSIAITVKDSDSYDFITARLSEYNGGTVVIA